MTAVIMSLLAIMIIIGPLVAALVIAFAGSRKLRIQDIELNVHKGKRFERIRWIFNEQLPVEPIPVMFQRGAVLRDKKTGKNLLQLKFINTGTKEIKSVYAAVNFIDDAGDIVADGSTIKAEYLDVNCEGKGTFGQKQLLELGDIGAIHIRVEFNKVVFADGTVWRAGQIAEAPRFAKITFLKNTLPPELQSAVGEDTICKPEILGNGLWRCSCGCLVADGESCTSCQRTLSQAQRATDIRELEQRVKEKAAEAEQEKLDKQIANETAKSYVKQLTFAIIALYVGTPFLLFCAVVVSGYYSYGGIAVSAFAILYAVYVISSCVSMIATALLVQKANKSGRIKEPVEVRKITVVQSMSALIPCVITIVISIFAPFGFLPSLIYCYQLPYVRNWLKRDKRLEQSVKLHDLIIFVICGTVTLN